MNIELQCIEMDTSIQCRAAIDTATVNDYAERMTEGDKFPPVVLYGKRAKCWIADGWHRIMAAKQIGAADIPADLREGGRVDALKAALGANAMHGMRRSNADKRRAVEIALREFGKMSTAAISELCGVSRPFAESLRPQDATVASSRTGSDGKQYPTTRRNPPSVPQDAPDAEPPPDAPDGEPDAPQGQPDGNDATPTSPQERRPVGLTYAMSAIDMLKRIPQADTMRVAGFREVAKFITHEMKGNKNERT